MKIKIDYLKKLKGMFTNDRVSLDAKFTNYQANNRYVGWVLDEKNLVLSFLN